MRKYGKIETAIWKNPKFKKLSSNAKLVYLYLISSPHSNAIGLYRFDTQYVPIEVGLSTIDASETVSELFANGFVTINEPLELVLINGWWGHNTVENPNVAKAVVAQYADIPECEEKERNINDLFASLNSSQAVFETLSKRLGNPFETLSEPFRKPHKTFLEGFRNPEPEPEPEPLPKPQKEKRKSFSSNDPVEQMIDAFDAARYEIVQRRRSKLKRSGDVDYASHWVAEGVQPQAAYEVFKRVLSEKARLGEEMPDQVWCMGDHINREFGLFSGEERKWENRVEVMKSSGYWDHGRYGPEPGQEGCNVPPRVLEKHQINAKNLH